MRLGIIGTGQMARAMARAAAGLGDVTVTAVLSRDVDRARGFCRTEAPAAQAFDNAAAFLDAVDAVYIATPPDTHLAFIETCLTAARPVLCEKPLTPDPQDTAKAIALSRQTGVPLVEAIWTLALPAYRALCDAVAAAELAGAARMRFDFSYPLVVDSGSHYLDPVRGGVLLDRAVYGLAAAITLLGDVVELHPTVIRDAQGLDRSADLLLRHRGGGQSHVSLSFDHLGDNSLQVASPKGHWQAGPPSLEAETLSFRPFHAPAPGAGGGKGGLKARLKAMPRLRRIRWRRQQAAAQFLAYGASPYAPVLAEFAEVVRSGAEESTRIPRDLSQTVADLVAQARAG